MHQSAIVLVPSVPGSVFSPAAAKARRPWNKFEDVGTRSHALDGQPPIYYLTMGECL